MDRQRHEDSSPSRRSLLDIVTRKAALTPLLASGKNGVHSLEAIRSEVKQRLMALGANGESMAETCLLQDNAYCARRFSLDGYQAVWFLEENQLKFFGPHGELLATDRTNSTVQREREQRRAAA